MQDSELAEIARKLSIVLEHPNSNKNARQNRDINGVNASLIYEQLKVIRRHVTLELITSMGDANAN